MAAMASSTAVPMVGWCAWVCRTDQRASGGTQKMFWARYSSAVFGGFCTPFDDLLHQLRVGFLEGVGDVLEEYEAEDDVLVLGGVHAAAEGVGHAPELGAVVEGLAGVGASGGHGVSPGNC